MLYPMYVISVVDLCTLQRTLSHQELKAQGRLVVVGPEHTGGIVFVSHQWLGWHSPDPDSEQLHALQHVLRNWMEDSSSSSILTEGSDQLTNAAADLIGHISHMYIWMDWISMPKSCADDPNASADLTNAVNSIPAYIESSRAMLVLATPCQHTDSGLVCNYSTWRKRGWCRMELFGAVLARHNLPVIVVHGVESSPVFIWRWEAWFLRAGKGNFTCCAKGHDFGYGPVPCDKIVVGRVIETMLDAKAQAYYLDGDLLSARYWAMMQPFFMQGLPRTPTAPASAAPQPPGDALDTALARLKRAIFFGRDEAEETRWTEATGITLLHAAVLTMDLAATRELLATPAGRADMHRPITARTDGPGMFNLSGITPWGLCSPQPEWATIETLLNAGANPWHRDLGNLGNTTFGSICPSAGIEPTALAILPPCYTAALPALLLPSCYPLACPLATLLLPSCSLLPLPLPVLA